MAQAAPAKWDPETFGNIRWFKDAKPPTESFQMTSGVTVSDVALFWKRITEDIEAGPVGPRANTGAIQSDLRRLRELFGRAS